MNHTVANRLNHPITLALLSALLFIGGMPFPFGYWPLLATAIVPLIHISARHTPIKAFFGGFLAGLLHYTVLLYWVVIAMGRYGGLPWWISIPALLALSCYMACYTALFCGLLSWIKKHQSHNCSSGPSIAHLWPAPFLWVGLDYIRGELFTGFPWMDPGYGLYNTPLLIQAADLGGHHLITFALVVINLLIAQALGSKDEPSLKESRTKLFLTSAFGCFLICISVYSLVRYNSITAQCRDARHISAAIVQGNISQDAKWSPEKKEKTILNYRHLTRLAVEKSDPELVIWPETAIPFFPLLDPLFNEVRRLTNESNIHLLSGAPFFSVDDSTSPPTRQYYNSGLLINPEGEIDYHHKQHLVPFGEYVPLRRFFPFLEPLVVNVGDFQAGTSTAPLVFNNRKIGILICFESIFPDLAGKITRNGAEILVNITNDAWYGRSSAPYHTLAMSVFRAVENRRSLIRAANTGISCLIEPTGKILGQTPLFQPAVVSVKAPILTQLSPYDYFGYLFAPLCLIISIARLLFLLTTRPGRQKAPTTS